MAKVNIVIDTDEATISATVNGKKVDNIMSINVYKSTDMYSKNQDSVVEVNINSMTKDENGVKTYTGICAEKSVAGRTALVTGTVKSEFDDFLINPVINVPHWAVSEYAEATNSVKRAFSNIFGSRREKNETDTNI